MESPYNINGTQLIRFDSTMMILDGYIYYAAMPCLCTDHMVSVNKQETEQ